MLLLLLWKCCPLFIGVCCWQCLQFINLSFCSLPRFSDWSVVFVFNASHSALAPSSRISLSICWCCLLAISAIHPSSTLFFAHLSDSAIEVLCLSSMPRSVLLLLHRQSRCLLVWCLLLEMACNSSIFITFFLLTFQLQYCQCCVGLQCLAQCSCSFITDFVVYLWLVLMKFLLSVVLLFFYNIQGPVLPVSCWP